MLVLLQLVYYIYIYGKRILKKLINTTNYWKQIIPNIFPFYRKMPPVIGKPHSGQTIFQRGKSQQLLLAILTTFVFVTANSETKTSNTITFSPTAHTLAKASCSSTLHPELCYSSIAESLDNNVQSPKDVIFVSLNVTVQALKRNHLVIDKFLASSRAGNLTEREKTALEDCKETIEDSVDEIHTAIKDLHQYPFNKSLKRHADDLKTLISSAITNQVSISPHVPRQLSGFDFFKVNKIEY